MSDAFERAFTATIAHEGGDSDDARDPGGQTRYGISKRSYPDVDIAALTLEGARAIYRRDFWFAIHLDQLPDRLAIAVFDGAVNSGARPAIGWLQWALGVTADGVIGPLTIRAALDCDQSAVLMRWHGKRLAYLADLSTWTHYGRGWARRVARNLQGG